MRVKTMIVGVAALLATSTAFGASDAKDNAKILNKAATVLSEIRNAPDSARSGRQLSTTVLRAVRPVETRIRGSAGPATARSAALGSSFRCRATTRSAHASWT